MNNTLTAFIEYDLISVFNDGYIIEASSFNNFLTAVQRLLNVNVLEYREELSELYENQL